jgi:hypothetical protein
MYFEEETTLEGFLNKELWGHSSFDRGENNFPTNKLMKKPINRTLIYEA